ncbi:hypothetical protein VTI28DRAFT_10521 [Corynascus sepedonium]
MPRATSSSVEELPAAVSIAQASVSIDSTVAFARPVCQYRLPKLFREPHCTWFDLSRGASKVNSFASPSLAAYRYPGVGVKHSAEIATARETGLFRLLCVETGECAVAHDGIYQPDEGREMGQMWSEPGQFSWPILDHYSRVARDKDLSLKSQDQEH